MNKQISFKLNGRQVSASVSPGESLLDVLRNRFHLGGARETCALGLCGVCTVIVSGNPVSSCLYMAPAADGEEIVTIEGLETEDALHPVQEAFMEHTAFQCGYCTPGMILMAKKLLEENPDPSEDEIKEFMSGNICRCASYGQIIQAIQAASQMIQADRMEGAH
ncbi:MULTISPECIES: (2Fe-2S)-binding protein [Paenibacillus]|uniref:Xanthine dehydrogenase n=1 Tax=Paenibacillus naphthalenovorans TaxID=162209 RepID=A0A0U2W1F6_9BACL|nr:MULTISPECIES: (2Fe-2S)-binding protein [Paenibacillus]ALS22372.1 xanthine dehydrogenase [Paenibacillus naphthalenovorans]NTZ16836.1 (2Fe-2S)-binding protein [Paenibacillus sp. JMULE4]GCL70160.1 (2Fe-2S)-binding protein [Paenibacillus naphthalenovorans]